MVQVLPQLPTGHVLPGFPLSVALLIHRMRVGQMINAFCGVLALASQSGVQSMEGGG
jgi:hypothetical protein